MLQYLLVSLASGSIVSGLLIFYYSRRLQNHIFCPVYGVKTRNGATKLTGLMVHGSVFTFTSSKFVSFIKL
jgi:hypothetical protein